MLSAKPTQRQAPEAIKPTHIALKAQEKLAQPRHPNRLHASPKLAIHALFIAIEQAAQTAKCTTYSAPGIVILDRAIRTLAI